MSDIPLPSGPEAFRRIEIREADAALDFPIRRDSAELSRSEARRLSEFLESYRRAGEGPLVVAPSERTRS